MSVVQALKAILLDVSWTANQPINAASPGAPVVSAWQRMKGVDSVQFALATTGTENGTWTAQVSNDNGASFVEHATLGYVVPYPTGAASSATVTIPMLGYQYIRLTFTPIGGAGNATATIGVVSSYPVDVARLYDASIQVVVAAADTLAGTWSAQNSNDWSGAAMGTVTPKSDGTADGNWPDTGKAIPALVASTGENKLVSLTPTEYGGLRLVFTPTAGFGSPKATFVGSGT